VLFPFSLSFWAHHDDVNLNAPTTDPRDLLIPENKAQIAGMHATILEVAVEQHGICFVDYKVVPTCYSSIKTGTLVGCGATDGDAGFGVVHLKTGEKSADVSGVHDDHQLSNFPFAGLVQ